MAHFSLGIPVPRNRQTVSHRLTPNRPPSFAKIISNGDFIALDIPYFQTGRPQGSCAAFAQLLICLYLGGAGEKTSDVGLRLTLRADAWSWSVFVSVQTSHHISCRWEKAGNDEALAMHSALRETACLAECILRRAGK